MSGRLGNSTNAVDAGQTWDPVEDHSDVCSPRYTGVSHQVAFVGGVDNEEAAFIEGNEEVKAGVLSPHTDSGAVDGSQGDAGGALGSEELTAVNNFWQKESQ